MPIKALLFDFGGVILDLDIARTRAAFAALGCKNFAQVWSLAKQADFFMAYETGKLSDAQFRDALRQHLNIPQATDSQLDEAWNAMLVGIKPSAIATLTTLRQAYPVYLLSNTNDLHIVHVEKTFLPQHGKRSLADLFDQTFLSQKIGFRKPSPEIFHHAVAAMHLSPSEILFIDDLPMNVDAARKLGLQGHDHPHGEPLDARTLLR